MCTNFILNAGDGSYINGRSMEFGKWGIDESQIVLLPKGEQLFAVVEGEDRATFKYNVIGMNAGPHKNVDPIFPDAKTILTDGMNDQGLACGSLWMPDSNYRKRPELGVKSVFVAMFNNWVLGCCASVDEVREQIKAGSVVLWENGMLQELNMLPLHFAVMDKCGKQIVIEYTNDDGTPSIYDNPVNVLTNAPGYPTQVTLMEKTIENNGQRIQPNNPATTPYPGNGYGLIGTPGDPTPPARFTKIAIWKEFATDTTSGYGLKTARDSKILAWHLLNCVDIPYGVCRFGGQSDYTAWSVVKDLTNLEYQVRMYGSSVPYSISFSAFDCYTWTEPKVIPIPDDLLALPLDLELKDGSIHH
ncbi:MAG: linear amide C-N hydrolase [Candidatus Thiodiazotropha sp.]